MSTVADRADTRPVFRSVAAQARRIPSCRIDKSTHPATVARWITTGVKLQDGSTLKLIATRSPGGWLITDEAIDHFLATLTADRCGEPTPTAPSVSAARQRELAGVDAQLSAIGLKRHCAETGD